MVSGVLLNLLLLGMMILAFHIQPVESEIGTIIVPDDYATIQEAVNNADEGYIIHVRNGTYYGDVVVNKTVSVVGEVGAVIVSNDSYAVVLVSASNVLITGFEIQNIFNSEIGWGIKLESSSNCTVKGNVVKAILAIFVEGGSGNDISDNTVVGLPDLYGSLCVFNGLQIRDSSSNIVTSNYLSWDCHDALTMIDSNNNYIAFNTMAGHSVPFPITVIGSNKNLFLGNTIWPSFVKTSGYGHINFESSSNNILYHNNFMSDHGSVGVSIDDLSTNNTWDNGCEGNYWGDYNGTDTSSPLDGIGDTYLPWEGLDSYPLMNPYWNPGDINHDLKVDITDVAIAASAYGSYPGHPKWNCHADITGAEYLIPDGKVDIRDIALIASNFGKTYS